MGAFGQVFGVVAGKPVNTINVKFENEGLVAIAVGDVLASWKILKRWNIIPDPVEALPQDVSRDFFHWAVGRVLTGVGQVRLAQLRSDDNGVSYSIMNEIGFTTGSFVAGDNFGHNGGMSNDSTDFAVGVRNTDGATTGEIKVIKSLFDLNLPLNYQVVEV